MSKQEIICDERIDYIIDEIRSILRLKGNRNISLFKNVKFNKYKKWDKKFIKENKTEIADIVLYDSKMGFIIIERGRAKEDWGKASTKRFDLNNAYNAFREECENFPKGLQSETASFAVVLLTADGTFTPTASTSDLSKNTLIEDDFGENLIEKINSFFALDHGIKKDNPDLRYEYFMKFMNDKKFVSSYDDVTLFKASDNVEITRNACAEVAYFLAEQKKLFVFGGTAFEQTEIINEMAKKDLTACGDNAKRLTFCYIYSETPLEHLLPEIKAIPLSEAESAANTDIIFCDVSDEETADETAAKCGYPGKPYHLLMNTGRPVYNFFTNDTEIEEDINICVTDVLPVDRNISEIKFYNHIKEKLTDYKIYYSFAWFGTDDNGNPIKGEGDFVIIKPGKGFIVIEKKSQSYLENCNGKFKIKNIHGKDAYKQAMKTVKYIKGRYVIEYSKEFNGFAEAATFYINTNHLKYDEKKWNAETVDKIRFKEDEKDNEKERKTFIYDADWDSIAERINEIFSLSESDYDTDELIKLMDKNVRNSYYTGTVLRYSEKELAEINKTQDTFAELLLSQKNAVVVGGAGTGKTFVAAKLLAKSEGGKILLTPRRLLNNSIPEIAKKAGINIKNIEHYTVDDFLNFVAANPEYYTGKFDTVIIDELQTIEDDKIKSLLEMADKVYLFYDRDQKINDKKREQLPFEKEIKEFGINENKYILRKNLRNTKNIFEHFTSKSYYKNNFKDKSEPNELKGLGVDEKKFFYRDLDKSEHSKIRNYVEKEIERLVFEENVPIDKIVILVNDKRLENIFEDMKIGEKQVDCTTAEMYRGVENDIVFAIENTDGKNDFRDRITHLAETRAKFKLYVVKYKRFKNERLRFIQPVIFDRSLYRTRRRTACFDCQKI
jgi:hypothetical protein